MTFSPEFWTDIQVRYEALSEEIALGKLDYTRRPIVQKELSSLSHLLTKKKEIDAAQKELSELSLQLATTTDADFKTLIEDEIEIVQKRLKSAFVDLETILYPPDPLDNRAVFLEIRAGTGGQEAALFAGDVARMYTNYAIRKNWKVSITSESHTDLGGYRDLVMYITGKGVYGHLKYESGVHRVQRVPKTEGAGRIHTSTITIAVIPEAEEVEFSVIPSDLRIDVYRASGAGGQHVNTTDSAVRITHIPTGVVVTCQDERSQHKNKATAMKMLQSRLYQAHREKQDAEASKQRKELVGTGERSEKVRTYNYPQNRVTDHQVDVTLKKLDMIMEGDLDDIIEPLMSHGNAERRARQTEQV